MFSAEMHGRIGYTATTTERPSASRSKPTAFPSAGQSPVAEHGARCIAFLRWLRIHGHGLDFVLIEGSLTGSSGKHDTVRLWRRTCELGRSSRRIVWVAANPLTADTFFPLSLDSHRETMPSYSRSSWCLERTETSLVVTLPLRQKRRIGVRPVVTGMDWAALPDSRGWTSVASWLRQRHGGGKAWVEGEPCFIAHKMPSGKTRFLRIIVVIPTGCLAVDRAGTGCSQSCSMPCCNQVASWPPCAVTT